MLHIKQRIIDITQGGTFSIQDTGVIPGVKFGSFLLAGTWVGAQLKLPHHGQPVIHSLQINYFGSLKPWGVFAIIWLI